MATFGPATSNRDTFNAAQAATTGYGSGVHLSIFAFDNAPDWVQRIFQYWDISAIPPGATIISATLGMELNLVSQFAGENHDFRFVRCIRTDWTDGDGAPEYLNWDNYKIGSAWTAPGGDLDLTVADGVYSETTAGAKTYDVINNVTDAYNNRSGIVSLVTKYDDEVQSAVGGSTLRWDSLNTITGTPPTLTIVYEVAGAFNRSRIVNMGVTGPQNRSTIANA